jgi:hypothetical protein
MARPNAARIGWVLSRVVVPMWVAAGAVVKLIELSPRTLPKETILNVADQWGLNLYYVLATLIAAELLAVVVMLMVSRLARPMALFTLSLFCLILIGELVQGNLANCGCFGNIPVPPWAMLIVDGLLLLGVAVFDPTPVMPASPARWPAFGAVVLAAAGATATFWRVIPAGQAPEIIGSNPLPRPIPNPNPTDQPADPTINPDPVPLPGYWFTTNVDVWEGKPWREIELFSFMPTWPQGLDSGKRYVTFYGRTCDHCDDMFHADLTDPALGSMTTAVEVPVSKDELRGSNPWPMAETRCEHLQLPVGCDWIFTTPLTLTIEDGIVTCAEEGGHMRCMGLE